MENQKTMQGFKKFSVAAGISFLVSIVFCAFLTSVTIVNRTNIEKLKLEQQISETSRKICEKITKLLYKTQALSAIVIQGNGSADSFDIIAPSIVDDPVIQNVLLAPDGIVTKIYPFTENASLIGWNYFDDGAGNREAMEAIELGDLVLGGPIDVQGGKAIFGGFPVYIDTPAEKHKFWGLVSVMLKFPQILEYAELGIFDAYGSTYELWKINPDTNEKQVIASNYERVMPNSNFIEKPVSILNAQWYLKVSLKRTWYSYPENIGLIIAGFCISLIVLFVMQHNYELKNMQSVFELMAITDPLTGIFNRRYFFEIVRIGLEKARRHKEKCYFIMLDIDRFKIVNDTYGHLIGDKVLMDVTARIKADIRPYDLFARYGGEEFIIFTVGINKEEVCEMTERLRVSLCDRKFEYENVCISCSASFGIAPFQDYNLDTAIKQSDEALYMAKRNGRNCVAYYTDS